MENKHGIHAVFFLWIGFNKVLGTDEDLCTFENDDCGFTNVTGFDTKWFRSNGTDHSEPKKDHTINSKNGYFMKISAATPGSGRMETKELYNSEEICLTFYYLVFGQNFITFYILMKINNETKIFRFVDLHAKKQDEWQKWGPEPINDRGSFAIIFEGNFSGSADGGIAIDDIYSGKCKDVPHASIQSTEGSQTTGIAVGIVVGIAVLVVLISVVVYFVRRSKPDSSKSQTSENFSNDYTGHQNNAFPMVNIEVNTTSQYDNLSPDNDEQHYSDIKEDRLAAQDTLPHNYIAVYDYKGVPESNTHVTSESLINGYACLDPSVTGYNRKGFSPSAKRDQQNNIKYNNAAVDDSEYAEVDPSETICHTEEKPATATSDNYTVLDPNETGFDRTKCVIDTKCPYEMASPIVGYDKNTESSNFKRLDDPYEHSGEEAYNTTKDIQSRKLDDNVYSHSVDNVYDSASHTRKQNDIEKTYDHFVGQKKEDDYDISTPK